MKNKDSWQPTKYVYRKGKLAASRDPKQVATGSRFMADTVAGLYDVHLKLYAQGRLLDLGCGQVPLYVAYKDLVASVRCVDWTSTLHKNEHLDVECDITQALPFGEGEFDTILLSDVLEHIPQPERLFNEMSRILASGGHVLVNVPFFYWLHECPHDYHRYTEFALRRLVEDSGLRLVHLQAIGGSPEVVADMIAKHAQPIPVVGSGLAVFVQYATAAFVRSRIGMRVSKRTSQVYPWGYFLVAGKE